MKQEWGLVWDDTEWYTEKELVFFFLSFFLEEGKMKSKVRSHG